MTDLPHASQRNLQKPLKDSDPEMAQIIVNEEKRQRGGIQLIASEVRDPFDPRSMTLRLELRSGGSARGCRLCDDQQVL